MYRVNLKASVETCTGHRLMDYAGKCAFLHGHNYTWKAIVHDVMEDADVKYGLSLDFSKLKALLKQLTEPFDHAMVLREDDPFVARCQAEQQRLVVLSVNPTAENLASFMSAQMSDHLDHAVTIELWETENNSVTVCNPTSPVQVVYVK